MKKTLSILLAALMIATVLCIPVMATGVSDTDVAKIGDVGYATLDEAIAAVKNGETIVLLKDATLSAFNQSAINYTIDGQDQTYTVTTNATWINVGDANITFDGVKVELGVSAQNVFQSDTNKTGDLTFIDSHVKAYNNSFYKLNGKGNFTLKNSTWEKMSGDATAFYFRGDHKDVTDTECVITVEDSSIINHAGSATALQNNNIFHWNSSNGSTAKFYLKGNTVIKNASATANLTGSTTLFYNEQPNATMIINAEPTVQLVLDSTTVQGPSYFIYSKNTATGSPNTILNGTPQFIASPHVVSKGVYMPDIVHKDGDIRYTNKWSADGGTTSFAISTDNTTAYKYTAEVTENVTFTPVNVGLTAETGAYGVRKFDGVIEYYATMAEAQYRTCAVDEAFVFLKDETWAGTTNLFSGFFNGKINTYTVAGANKADGSKIKVSLPLTYVGVRNATFENLDITNTQKEIDTDPAKGIKGGSLTFNNCVLTTKGDIRVTRGMAITFNNSTLISTHSGCTFYMRNNGNGDGLVENAPITINNSHIINNGAGSGGNSTIFHVNADNPHTVNIKGNSIIENRSSGKSSTSTNNSSIIYNQKKDNGAVFNVDESVVFALNTTQTGVSGLTFVRGSKSMTLNGTPTYKVGDNTAATGFTYISGTVNTGATGTLLGFSGTTTEGAEKVLVPNTVAAGKLTKGFSAKPVYFTDADYDMIDGASLRTIYEENGIRFTSFASDALLAELAGAKAVEFHTLIANKELLGTGELTALTAVLSEGATVVTAIDVKSTKTQADFVNGETTYDNAYHAALLLNDETVDAATRYQLQLVARGYFTVTYADGTTATFYTVCDDNNVRSMLDVATALDATGNYDDNRVVQGVIDACSAN